MQPVSAPPLERRSRRLPWRVMGAVVMLLALIVALTVCPVKYRPSSGIAHLDRAAAYATLGFFIALTCRRRPGVAVTATLALAFGLEAVQLLVPGRDARVEDACVKAAGGVAGAVAAYAMYPARRWLQRRLHPLQIEHAHRGS